MLSHYFIACIAGVPVHGKQKAAAGVENQGGELFFRHEWEHLQRRLIIL